MNPTRTTAQLFKLYTLVEENIDWLIEGNCECSKQYICIGCKVKSQVELITKGLEE